MVLAHCIAVLLLHDFCEAAKPAAKCGCALHFEESGKKSCAEGTEAECGTCENSDCSGGACPFTGVGRDGWCYEEPGTHNVCATVTEDALSWFQQNGNDLSSVVVAGKAWCLCEHWALKAVCCHSETSLDFHFDASNRDKTALIEQWHQAEDKEAAKTKMCKEVDCPGSTQTRFHSHQKGVLEPTVHDEDA